MKIASADVQLQSSHVSFTRREVSERIEMWIGERNPPAGRGNGVEPQVRQDAHPNLAISSEGLATLEAEAARSETDEVELDPRLRVLKHLIEVFTGRPIRTLKAEDLRTSAPPVDLPDRPPSQDSRNGAANRAGFGVEYEYRSSYQEYEGTRFAAEGTVRTADGREIRFTLEFEMEHAYSETSSVELRLGDARMKDPLVIDFAGPAAALSDLRFAFDLDADGRTEDIPMLAGGRGYLAIDRNENGRIDDGSELFGPTSGDGFAELAALDGDGNGWIDEGDAAYARLRAWKPTADGQGSLTTAADAGVGALHLGHVATPFDLRGAANDTLGAMRTTGIYLREDGSAGTVSQIDVSV